MKKRLVAALAMVMAAMLLSTCALAVTELREYSGPSWSFGVALEDIDETLFTLASPVSPLGEADVPADLVKVKSRHNDQDGNNDNGGIYKASSSEMQVADPCYIALQRMFADAEVAGFTLYLRQGYRSYEDQARRYASAVEKGETDGVYKPGETDYQTGLAVTVVGKDWRAKSLSNDIVSSAEHQWLLANAARYGFVLRNPEGKEDLTGTPYEAWHLRYVGSGVATYISQQNYCLEEFLDDLAQAKLSFEQAGGNLEDARNMVRLPDGPVILLQTDDSGDHEITIFH